MEGWAPTYFCMCEIWSSSSYKRRFGPRAPMAWVMGNIPPPYIERLEAHGTAMRRRVFVGVEIEIARRMRSSISRYRRTRWSQWGDTASVNLYRDQRRGAIERSSGGAAVGVATRVSHSSRKWGDAPPDQPLVARFKLARDKPGRDADSPRSNNMSQCGRNRRSLTVSIDLGRFK